MSLLSECMLSAAIWSIFQEILLPAFGVAQVEGQHKDESSCQGDTQCGQVQWLKNGRNTKVVRPEESGQVSADNGKKQVEIQVSPIVHEVRNQPTQAQLRKQSNIQDSFFLLTIYTSDAIWITINC